VIVEAEGLSLEGSIHVKTGGYRTRVSDLLNEEPPFLAITDVRIGRLCPETGQLETEQYDTIILRKDLIKYVIPLD
jgi:hypothetical protein